MTDDASKPKLFSAREIDPKDERMFIEFSAFTALQKELDEVKAENEKLRDDLNKTRAGLHLSSQNLAEAESDIADLYFYKNEAEKEFPKLRAQLAEAQAENLRLQMLIKIADVLITNENAIKDWEDAKQTRAM